MIVESWLILCLVVLSVYSHIVPMIHLKIRLSKTRWLISSTRSYWVTMVTLLSTSPSVELKGYPQVYIEEGT